MKADTAAHVAKARGFMAKAQTMMEQGWPDEAGRASYMAGFHAALALLFEKTDKTPHTHSGVHSEFAKIVKDDPGFSLEQRRFLGRAYNLKSMADYETNAGSVVTEKQALDAIEAAGSFIATVITMLPPETHQKPSARA